MAISKDLLLAILSLDSYNRGYLPGLAGLGGVDSSLNDQIGNAVVTNENRSNVAQDAGFYAVAYDTPYGTVISYRGTNSDEPSELLKDVFYGWTAGIGFSAASQAGMALEFYTAVTGKARYAGAAPDVTVTGHSLGGGLAGFVSSLSGTSAVGFNWMPFGLAAYAQYASDWFLGRSPIHEPNFEAFRGIEIDGELLQFGRNGTLELGLAYLLGWVPVIGPVIAFVGGVTGLTTPALEALLQKETFTDDFGAFGVLERVDLHSQALVILLQYAKDHQHTDWGALADEFFPAFFDDTIGEKAGFEKEGVEGVYDYAQKMLAAIAYSALDEGTLVFGNTGIRALFDDADELGRLTAEGKVPVAHANPIPGLAEAIVQFAGQMARGKVDYTTTNWAPHQGILTTYESDGVEYLYVDLAKELWTLNGLGGKNPDKDVDIKGITTILDAFFAQEEEAAIILAAMNTLYGSNATSTIDRIDFALGSGSLKVELPDRGEEEGVPPEYNPATTSLFVALNGDDEVDGNSDNNMLVGGAGDDILYGRLGRDIIVGGPGSDRIIDLVGEVGTDGRSNEDDVYFGEPSDQGLLATFLAWLLGTQSEDTVEYRLTDERQGASPPSQGVEITRLDVAENFGEEVVTLDLKNLNSGKTGTDYLVNIDKVILSERRDEVVVNPAWLDVPLWLDLGKAIQNRVAA